MLYRTQKKDFLHWLATKCHRWKESNSFPDRLQAETGPEPAKPACWAYDKVTHRFCCSRDYLSLYGIDGSLEEMHIPEPDKHIVNHVHPEDRTLVAGWVRELMAAGGRTTQLQGVHRVLRNDGEVRYIMVRAELLEDESKGQHIIYGICQDQTEQRGFSDWFRGTNDHLNRLFSGPEPIHCMNDMASS